MSLFPPPPHLEDRSMHSSLLPVQVEVAKRQVQELSKMTATVKGQGTSCQSVADQSTDSLDEAELLSSPRYQINLLPAPQKSTVPAGLVSLLVLPSSFVSAGRLPALSWKSQCCHQMKTHCCLSSCPRDWRVSALLPSSLRRAPTSRVTSRSTLGARPAPPTAARPSTSP